MFHQASIDFGLTDTAFQGKPYWHPCAKIKNKTKKCLTCKTRFNVHSGNHKFCSVECRGDRSKYLSTEHQYKTISGNWDRYFSRLVNTRRGDQNRKIRKLLSRQRLLDIYNKQCGLCALSGIEMTCKLKRGTKFWTNASIDRIEPGGPYTVDNVQLVCSGLNSWRSSMPQSEFIEICRKVSEHNRKP